MRHLFLTVVTLLLLPASTVTAGPNGTVEGKVFDIRTKTPLAGVNILLVNTALGTITNFQGEYRIINLPAGVYIIRATLIGYRTVLIRDVRVVADVRTRIDIRMEETTLEIGAVEVVAQAPPILKDVTGTVHTIASSEINLLPINTFLDVVALQPGVTADFHIRGGKISESLYLVDGMPVQDVISGGVGTELPLNSISSMNIQTGGYEAEYGNALSGVVNIVTKSGSNENWFSMRAETDYGFTGEQTNRFGEIEVSVSGPILSDRFFYFGAVDVRRSDTRFWQDLSRFFDSPIEQEGTAFGKLTYILSPNTKLQTQILASGKEWRDYEYSWRFNLSGIPPRSRYAYRGALSLSQTLTNNLVLSFSAHQFRQESRIGTSTKGYIDTTLYQYDFFLQYVIAGTRAWRAMNRQVINTIKGDLIWEISRRHLVKAGTEINFYDIYSDIFRLEPRKNIWGKPFITKPMLNYGTEYSYHPLSGSMFVQDKIELSEEGMLLNFGLRLDYLDPTAKRPAAERVPISEDEYQTNIVNYVPAKKKTILSPRLGFSVPYAEKGYLFINYGHYVQFPLFEQLYSGLNTAQIQKGVGALIGNPDLNPERTKAWEISIKYALEDNTVISATYFDKVTFDQIDVKTFVPTIARIAGDFGFAEFVNNAYARSMGLELLITKETGDWLIGSFSYTLMSTEGLSQDARQGLQYYQWGFEPPPKVFPLSWDQQHTIKAVFNFRLPWESDMIIIWNFNSGRPYTYYPTRDGFTPLDSTLKFLPNNERMSDVHLVQLKVTKRWKISDAINAVFYLDIRNMLNRKNVLWVDSAGKVGGELGDIMAYDSARRTRIGIRIEF